MRRAASAPPRGWTREEAQALVGLTALAVITTAWWALALWPVDGGPEWLARTRYVCFGVSESGLPDAGGWIGLIAGPLGMLAILLVGWRTGFRELLRRARRSRAVASVMATGALACLVLLTAAGVRVQRALDAVVVVEGNELLPPETYPRLDRAAPPLALVAQTGEVVDLADLRGAPVLVTFAFAHCQTVCPIVVRDALRAREALAGSALQPAVLVVTLDPWRDTPSRLEGMARGWGLPDEGAWVLSGAVPDVEAVLDAWEVPRSRDTTSGDVTHPALTYVVDADGRLSFASSGGAESLVSLIRRL